MTEPPSETPTAAPVAARAVTGENVKTSYSASPEADGSAAETPTIPVLPLEYADPSLRRGWIRWWWVFVTVRRIVFAVGVALFFAGFASGLTRDDTTFLAVGWGAGLVALVIPFPALSRRPSRD